MQKRYAIVGTGSRHAMYRNAILERFDNRASLVALLDTNPGRLELARAHIAAAGREVDTFVVDDADGGPAFDRMIRASAPDTVIVTSMDRTHDEYICRALRAGCDVVTEKPLTTDAEKLQRILDARAETGRDIAVTFNLRFSPVRAQLKSLLMEGVIGEVTAVDFQWLLDTRHGADYFRRWHREKRNAGGLLVHKATHHFDLVNWWLADVPAEVSAVGERRFYRPTEADALGLQPAERCSDCASTGQCPFYLDLDRHPAMQALYRRQEHHDGYFRDRCVFAESIDIEDTMHVRVRYARGARLNYSLIAYAPWEGYRIAFTGTRGRIEHDVRESSYVSGDGTVQGDSVGASLKLYPHFEAQRPIERVVGHGHHGGGDALLLEGVFASPTTIDPLHRAADFRSGAWSILVGIAANRSIASGELVRAADLVHGLTIPPDLGGADGSSSTGT